MDQDILQRYASPRWPHLFSKEMMFKLSGDVRGKRVLEVGCGEGVASVQLAYCGAVVDAIDLSPISIDVGKERAELNGQDVNFIVGDFTKSGLVARDSYDIVWCDLILHHLTDSLPMVMETIHSCLKPGGLFIAREPIAYASWLKALRRIVPIPLDDTPDEQPFRSIEFRIVEQQFPDLQRKYFGILGRLSRVSGNLTLLRYLGHIDNMLLVLPGSSALAGNSVMWASKTGQ